jgi:multicomponent Na+:H+ antiporter subunit G
MMDITGDILIGIGTAFMIWGTLCLMRPVSLIVKLHTLGISDTLGAILIISGLMFRYPERLMPLIMAFTALLFWGPMVAYLVAKGTTCAKPVRGPGREGDR